MDGIANSNWENHSCTHTNQEDRPWWYVDLGDDYDITDVWILNRDTGGKYQ